MEEKRSFVVYGECKGLLANDYVRCVFYADHVYIFEISQNIDNYEITGL